MLSLKVIAIAFAGYIVLSAVLNAPAVIRSARTYYHMKNDRLDDRDRAYLKEFIDALDS